MEAGDYNYYCSKNKKIRRGQIPVFGNWDFTNDLPITQYFECARQAGLGRYSFSSGECDPRAADLYSVAAQKAPPPRRADAVNNPPDVASQKTKPKARREKRCAYVNVKEEKKAGRICDVTQPPPKVRHLSHDINKSKLHCDVVSYPRPRITNKPPKAVDEDLYKIPSELLNNRKKKLGSISRCLVPICAA